MTCSKKFQAVRTAPKPDSEPRTTTPSTTTRPKLEASQPPPSHPSGPDVDQLAIASSRVAAESVAFEGSGADNVESRGTAVIYGGMRLNRKQYRAKGIKATAVREERAKEELRDGAVVGDTESVDTQRPSSRSCLLLER